MNRRTFLSTSSLAGLGIALPFVPQFKNLNQMEILDILENLVVLFQGDSITDAGRSRGAYYPNQVNGMGRGYAYHAVTSVLGKFPKANTKFYNRAVGGDKVHQMATRWEDDCLMLQPDVLSILIGVNDFWHTIDFNYKGTAKTYNDDYRKLLDRTKKTLPNTKLIIGEPFVLLEGTAIKKDKWIPTFKEYQATAKKIAKDYDAVFIPYQSIFDEALKHAPTSHWAPDGVHPSMAGNYLMAMAWLNAFMEVGNR